MDFFDAAFLALTGNHHLSWQKRLFAQHFEQGKLDSCAVIDIPTGMGKTMVMAIWLIARAQKASVPTRLIYVVDRRTVVDQASDLARKLRDNCKQALGIEPPAISTLRGQLADNREWSKDPSRPAIIVGTVDLIGSGMLFSGYRSSFKRRPLEAGLLGQDSILVLDEAHLSKPFEKLIRAIESFEVNNGVPMRAICMSATSGVSTDSQRPFTLQFDPQGNLAGEDANDTTISQRFGAKKRLTIVPLGEKEKLTDKLASEAINLAKNNSLCGKRIVVFARKPDDAKTVAKAIRDHLIESVDDSGPKPKIVKKVPYANSVENLTGTMRGLERDELVEKPVFKDRWLNGDLKPDDPANQMPVFLISTSAGEVGFDLNADHLVGDAAPLDSWIQRLGRVNRRGMGDAKIHLIVELPKKDGKQNKLEELERSIANTVELLRGIKDGDVSPKNIAHLKRTAWNMIPDEETSKEKPESRYDLACSSETTTVELTDILLDAWSMTSITEPMPGRPEVGPWLRGIDDELPQTTIAWRAELELVKDHPDPAKAKALQSVFAKHPIRPHESITTYSYHVAAFLRHVTKSKDRRDQVSTHVALRLSRGEIVLRAIKELADDPGILNAEPTLILPSTFGGLDVAGMLDAEAIPKAPKSDDPPPASLDVADQPGYEQREDAPARLRLLIRRTDNSDWAPEPLPGGVAFSDRLQLEKTYATSTALFADMRKANLRIRLVQPIDFDKEGDAVRSLILLTPVSNRDKLEDQSLDDHVGAVETEARRIAGALKLAEDDPVHLAFLFAARWHDEGKKAEVWQRFVYGPDATGLYKGKSSKTRDPKSLRGYRHEFGSLLRLHYPTRCGTTESDLPADAEARELALHLIATHHGAGRPHFELAAYQDFTTSERDQIHTESIRRFARLQRKYGWWHLAWLENLLRCADALASADQDAEDDPTDSQGDQP
jgi:CRISPR-associated endonuclease/helicase Cas3